MPDRNALALGLNVTSIVQLAFTPKDAAQLVVWEKSLGSAPATAMPMLVSAVLPMFVSVTGWAAPLSPTFTIPKVRFPVLRCATGSITSALRLTVCGLPAALSLIFRVAV